MNTDGTRSRVAAVGSSKIAGDGAMRSDRSLRTLQTFAVGTVSLIAGFGDGIGFSLTTLTGQRSPWVFLLPVLAIPLGVYVIAKGAGSLDRLGKLLLIAFGVFSALVLAEQVIVVRDFYLAGLIQLLVFVMTLILVSGVFVKASEWLATAFRRSLPAIHYFLCGYLVFSYVTWHLTGWDPSVRAVLTGAGASLRYYGFRPSGFSAEPAWSAIALAASYTAIHYLVPRHRLNAFIALLIATAALQSATAYVFVGAVVWLYAVERLRALRLPRPASLVVGLPLAAAATLAGAVVLPTLPARAGIAIVVLLHEVRQHRAFNRKAVELIFTGVLLGVGVAVGSVPQTGQGDVSVPPAITQSPGATTRPSSAVTQVPVATTRPSPISGQALVDRLGNIATGRDPSADLRVRSAVVAWQVIAKSFPVGVGYGNFREHAVYPPDLAAFIASADAIGRYKSDSFVLNYIAELGVLGAVLVVWAGAVIMRTRQALMIMFFILIVGLSGTLLLPPLLVMAAVVGLLERDYRAATLEVQRARSRELEGERT